MTPVLLLALTLGLPGAYAQDLSPLGSLNAQPSVQAARAQEEAARLGVQAARGLYSLGGGLTYSRSTFADGTPGEGLPAGGVQAGVQGQLGLTLRPFVVGDTATATRRAELTLDLARLGVRDALSAVQGAALSAAAAVAGARGAQAAAEAGAVETGRRLEVARLRSERGDLSAAELRGAEALMREASEQVRAAGETLAQALAQAQVYFGAAVPDLPLPARPPEGEDAASVRARVELDLARLDLAQAERALLPTVQASFTRTLEGGRTSLGVSLDSAALAPRLSVGFTSVVGDPPAPRSTLSLGAAFDLSAAGVAGVDAARARVRSAALALEGARRDGALQRGALNLQLDQAERLLALRLAAVQDAEQELAETQAREALGVVGPLETLRALGTLQGARVQVGAARSEQLARLIALYRLSALPLTEVRP
ncbi:TolC family protein [Deinococcus koreensis]|uniref:TolC family protein n=1 Tax=Deinococcus koreensis TaxID=2054903 RepID=A0A2K3UT75_9DEIO|nr:TolC family protein [Deinococcus koreensis]PNY79718.1 hypothetical protein CVO96_17335 [Deinococcus koreensis]